MPFIQAAERSLHYVQLPSDLGPDADHVIMVHGLAASMAFWYFNLAPQLAKKFNVTLYDLRGHGRSGSPARGYTPRAMADDLLDLMDALQIERAHIISHSYGGLIALHFTGRYPNRVQSLTVADSHLYSARSMFHRWEHGEKIQKVLRQRNVDLNVRDPFFGYRLLTEAARIQVSGRADQLDALREWVHPFIGRSGKRGARQWLRLLESTTAEADIQEDDGLSDSYLQSLETPTLAVYGENSQALGSGRRLAQLVPNSEFRIVPRAGHFFPASRPKELLGEWSQFRAHQVH